MKTFLLIIAMILYVVWSQLELHNYKKQIENERQRAYNIADLLETWKEIIAEYDIKFDIHFFKNKKGVLIEEVANHESANGEKLYVMSHMPSSYKQRNAKFNIYFSSLVLDSYYSITVDKNGNIKNISWDKP